jgi:hypothetical protein
MHTAVMVIIFWNLGHRTVEREVSAVIDRNYSWTFSPYRAVNTLRLCYKNQSVNVVWGNNRCLFSDPPKTHTHTLTHSHTHTHTHTLSHTHTHTHSLTHTHTRSPTHTHTVIHSLTHGHSHTHTVTHSLTHICVLTASESVCRAFV